MRSLIPHLVLLLACGRPALYEEERKPGSLQELDRSEECRFKVTKVRIREAEGEASDLPDGVIMRVEGVLGQVDEVNRNGRIYPRKLMQREAKNAKSHLEARDMYVLEDHPTWSEPMQGSVGKIAGIQAEIRLGDGTDNNIYGAMDIVDTASGRNVAAIVRAGGGIGISQRGYGSAVEDEYVVQDGRRVVARVVQDDYRLEGFDIVIGPSARAGVSGFKENENKEGEMKVTMEMLRLPENKGVLDTILAEGKTLGLTEGKALGLTEGKAAGIAEADVNGKVATAQREWETTHAMGIALERHFEGQADHKADPLARVRALESVEADVKNAAALRKVISEKASANPRIYVEAERLAFDPETGKGRMTVEALTATLEALLKGNSANAGDRPPRGAGHQEHQEPAAGSPEADAAFKKRLESVNRQRALSDLPALSEAALKAMDEGQPSPAA